MKQCKNCLRFLSPMADKCLYCQQEEFKDVETGSESINPNYRIYASEIIVDRQAYTIIKPLGKGGFGTVLMVKDTVDNRDYAMKVPLVFDEIFTTNKANSAETIAISQKYLENESDTLLRYSDDAFLYIYKKGTADALSKGKEIRFPVLIMELAEGTLHDMMQYEQKGNEIPMAEKIKIIREIVNAISHMHNQGVLHRDLCPGNFFAVDRGKKISYVLGDFGSAKSTVGVNSGNQATRTIGHSAYVDPARFEEKYKDDFRMDIYSLGIIIVEVLMGKSWQTVFGDENISHVLSIDFEKDFLLKEAPAHIADKSIIPIVQKAVKRSPEDRYDNIDDFRTVLFAALEITTSIVTHITNTTRNRDRELQARNCDFYFTIPLPFETTDHTFLQDIVTYEPGKKIQLRDYRGVGIEFRDFVPRQVKIVDTTLYSSVLMGKLVRLNFKKNELLRLLEPVGHIHGQLKGELRFKGTLEIKGEQW